jgi:excisionase family DNA binding protein
MQDVLALSGMALSTSPSGSAVTLGSPLLTAQDVAALLVVPRSSVYEYARRVQDPLPSMLIGRHRRFDRRAVEAWLGRQATGAM